MPRTITNINVEDVEKRRRPSKHYVYVICVSWSDQSVNIIYRRYSQFFELQNKLLDTFPVEAGSIEPNDRIIPFLPGKILFGRSHVRRVALERLQLINKYCKSLIDLPSKISEWSEVQTFFASHESDIQQLERKKTVKKPQTGSSISTPLLLEQYVAVDNYKKEASTETNLTAGALVEVVEKSQTGWWFVSSDGGQGWVPSSYLERIDGEEDDRILQKANALGKGEKYICSQNYYPQEADEIRLDKGALVEVLERNLDGWWLIRYNGQTGRAPATFLTRTDTLKAQRLIGRSAENKVQIIPTAMAISNLKLKSDSEGNKPINQLQMLTVPLKRNHPAQNKSEYHGNSSYIREDGLGAVTENQRKKYPQYGLANSSALPGKSKFASTESLSSGGEDGPDYEKVPPRRDQVDVKQRTLSLIEEITYMAHTPYVSDIPDGLDLIVGQKLKLLDTTDTGWWYLQNAEGQEGWAPAAYVEVHKDEEVSSKELKGHTKPLRPPPPKFPKSKLLKDKEEAPLVSATDCVYGNINSLDSYDSSNFSERTSNSYSTCENDEPYKNSTENKSVNVKNHTSRKGAENSMFHTENTSKNNIIPSVKPKLPTKPKIIQQSNIVQRQVTCISNELDGKEITSVSDKMMKSSVSHEGDGVSVKSMKSLFEN